MNDLQYWEEAVSAIAEERGVTLCMPDLRAFAQAMSNAHENYSQAFYSPPAGEHLVAENENLKRQLKAEQSKRDCPKCGGTGRVRSYGPTFVCDECCPRCNGIGKVSSL